MMILAYLLQVPNNLLNMTIITNWKSSHEMFTKAYLFHSLLSATPFKEYL